MVAQRERIRELLVSMVSDDGMEPLAAASGFAIEAAQWLRIIATHIEQEAGEVVTSTLQ